MATAWAADAEQPLELQLPSRPQPGLRMAATGVADVEQPPTLLMSRSPKPELQLVGTGVADAKQPRSEEDIQQNVETTDFVHKPIHPLAYAAAHCTLFAAHWMGASRFHKVARRKTSQVHSLERQLDTRRLECAFDPEDVHTFLRKDRSVVLHNFKRINPKVLKQIEAKLQEQGAPAAGLGSWGPPELPVEQQESVDEAAVSRNSEGPIEEDELYNNLFEKQSWPVFTICHGLIILLLWFIGSGLHVQSGSSAGYWTRKGGLDTLGNSFHFQTDLRWSNNECEDLRSQVWRWVTYQFTHLSFSHAIVNFVVTILLGVPLEGQHGFWRMAVLFNVGVAGGALFFFLAEAHDAAVGSSGGVYTLLGVHIADLLMNFDSTQFRITKVVMLLILIVVDIISRFVSAGEGRVSHAAHVGGALVGCLLGTVMVKNLSKKCYERILEAILGSVFVILMIVCCAWLGGHNDGPKNIFESTPGWCSIVMYRDIPVGSTIPRIMCTHCSMLECITALKKRYKTCCRPGVVNCISPSYCFQATTSSIEQCEKNDALWVEQGRFVSSDYAKLR